jgi:hypothetical protein
MRELDRVLRELAETGRVGGAERLIERLQRRLAGDPGQVISLGGTGIEMGKSSVTGRRGLVIATASLAAVLAIALPIFYIWGRGGLPATGVTTTLATGTTAGNAVPTTATGGAEPEMVTDQTAAGGLYWDDPGRLVAVSSEEVWVSGHLWELWPATTGDGIGHLVNGTWEYYRPVTGEEGSAPAGQVGGLTVAPDGTVLAATSLGVFSFDGQEWTLQYEEPTPAVAVADDGTVWIGWGGDHPDDPAAAGSGAWLARWGGASFVRVGPNPEAPPGGYSGPSTAMAALPGNQVWVTGGGWIPVTMHYDGTSGEAELDTTGMSVSAFAVAPDGDLWANQYRGGWTGGHELGRFDGSDWTYFEADPYLFRDESSLDPAIVSRVLQEFSAQSDKHAFFRQVTFGSLVIGLPLALYLLLHALLRLLCCLFLDVRISSLIASVLCLIVGLGILIPFLYMRGASSEVKNIPHALASES